MNVNEKLTGLKEVTGLNVYEDFTEEKKEKYLVFTYEDERPVFFGNDTPKADTAYIQLTLYTPAGFDYMELKHKIRNYLEQNGFDSPRISSWIEDEINGTKKIRHTVFETSYTEERMEEK